MTQKHWSASAERVKRRYAVLKGRRERDIVIPLTPFKIHQSYRPVQCFIWEFNPVLQEIWSGPAECRYLASSYKYLAKKCSDDGDDLNTMQ